MIKKRILLLIALFCLIALSFQVSAEWGCCVAADECYDYMTPSQPCSGTAYAGSFCVDIPDCQPGCCVTYLTNAQTGPYDIACVDVDYQVACHATSPRTARFEEGLCSSIGTCAVSSFFGDINGVIYYNLSNVLHPAVGALVSNDQNVNYTDNQGRYSFKNIFIGNRTVTAQVTDYLPVVGYIDVIAGQSVTLNLIAQQSSIAQYGNITGTITSGGVPVPGITVTCTGGVSSTPSDTLGHYKCVNVPAGTGIICSTVGTPSYPSVSHTVDSLAANEQKTVDFELVSGCGNGIIETDIGETCEPTNNPCIGPCIDCHCPTSCQEAGGNCFVFSNQCSPENHTAYASYDSSCGFSYVYTTATAYDTQSMQCCNATVTTIQHCSESVSQTPILNGITHCECNSNHFYNIYASPAGYCCNSVFSSSVPCSGGGLIVQVKNMSGSNLENANVTVARVGYFEGRWTGFNGQAYFPILSTGSYTVSANATGYETVQVTTTILASQTITVTITLGKVNLSCKTYIPSPTFSVTNVRGKSTLNLTWSDMCLNKISQFNLYRLDGTTLVPIASFPPTTSNYLDEGLEWDTTYTYILYAKSNSLSIPNNWSQASKFTGNYQCEGRFNSGYFCLDAQSGFGSPRTQKTFCDNDNIIHPSNCRTTALPNGICMGPDANGNAYCVGTTFCEGFGLSSVAPGYNIFGLYYNDRKDECEKNATTGLNNFCFYDRSVTTTDRCYNCNESGTCYDYGSEYACEKDNCYYGPKDDYDCKWMDTYYSELGEGICYAEGYDGTEYCTLCGPQQDPFENVMCTQTLCTALGSCYATHDNFSCKACDATTRCEDFDTSNCGEIKIDNAFNPGGSCKSSNPINDSRDPCHIGLCKVIGGSCVKDGNDDNLADCASYDVECQQSRRPVTSMTGRPMYINKQGPSNDEIGFTITGSGLAKPPATGGAKPYQFYYCMDDNTTVCCPNNNVTSAEGEVALLIPNDEVPLVNQEGMRYLRFFSIDAFNNTEHIKTEQIYVDTKAPTLTVDVNITNTSFTPDHSDINMRISSSEPVSCDYVLDGPSYDHMGSANFDSVAYSTFTVDDGAYAFSITCYDIYMNEQELDIMIYVDRIHNIFDENPNSTIHKSQAMLGVKTIFDVTCYFNNTLNGVGDWEQMQIKTMLADGSFQHNRSLIFEQNLVSGTYNFAVKCIKIDDATKNDVSNIRFTLDDVGPNTTIHHEVGGILYPINPSKYYRNPKIAINCKDYSYPKPPGEFGCKPMSIKYCTVSGTSASCNPTNPYYPTGKTNMFASSGTGAYSIHVISDDNGSNTNYSMTTINIDKNSPKFMVTEPANKSVFGPTPITTFVRGMVDDFSGADVELVWYDSSSNMRSKNATVDGLQFVADIELFDGPNTVKVTAKDHCEDSPNTNITYLLLYRDVYGPDITGPTGTGSPQIWNNKHQRSDDSFGTPSSAERMKPVTFNWSVEDNRYSFNVTDVNLTFRYQDGTNWTVNMGNHSGQYTYTTILTKKGRYRITYGARDKFGNHMSLDQSVYVDDTEGPIIKNITIICPENHYNSKGLLKVTSREDFRCTLIVEADEPIKSISDFKYTVKGNTGTTQTVTIEEAGSPVQGSPNIYVYPTGLYVPSTALLQGIEENATFQLKAKDDYDKIGTQIENGKYFEVDTFAPDIQMIYPLEDTAAEEMISIYGITVKSADVANPQAVPSHNVYVEHYVDTGVLELRGSVSGKSAPAPQLLDSGNTTKAYAAGVTQINVSDADSSLWTALNTDPDEKKYVWLSGHNREFGQFYEVDLDHCSRIAQYSTTTVGLIEPLEEQIPTLTSAYIYDGRSPPGWFDFQNLQITGGENVFKVFARDELGNTGNVHTIRIQSDMDSFRIVNRFPDQGETLVDVSDIYVFIEDNLSEIDMTSLNLTVRGEGFYSSGVCGSQAMYCAAYGRKVNITYNVVSLPEGQVNVTLKGKDDQGNWKEELWSFNIVRDVPQTPGFKTEPGQEHDMMWYANASKPKFILSFHPGEGVNVTDVYLMGVGDVEVTCGEREVIGDINDPEATITLGDITCQLSHNLTDGRYRFVVEAKRIVPSYTGDGGDIGDDPDFPGGTYPTPSLDDPTGIYINSFVIDTVRPELNITKIYETVMPNNTMNVHLYEDNPAYLMIHGDISDPRTYIAAINLSPAAHSYYYDINLTGGSEGNRTVLVTFYDLAGNYRQERMDIYYDSVLDYLNWTPYRYTNEGMKYPSVQVDRQAICSYSGMLKNSTMSTESVNYDIFGSTYSYTDSVGFYIPFDPVNFENRELEFIVNCKPTNGVQLNGTLDMKFRVYVLDPNLTVTAPVSGDQFYVSVINVSGVASTQTPNVSIQIADWGINQYAMPAHVENRQPFKLPMVLRSGTNSISVTAIDVAGNTNTVSIPNVMYTMQGPAVEWIEPSGTTNQMIRYIKAKITDRASAGLNLTATRFIVMNLDTNKYYTGAVSAQGTDIAVFTPSAGNLSDPGWYLVIVEPKDNAGTIGTAAYGYFAFDPSAPLIELFTPSNLVNSNSVGFSGRITSPSRILSSSLFVDNTYLSLVLSPSGDFQTTLSLPDGDYAVTIYAVNYDRKSSTYTRQFSVDALPPEVDITIN